MIDNQAQTCIDDFPSFNPYVEEVFKSETLLSLLLPSEPTLSRNKNRVQNTPKKGNIDMCKSLELNSSLRIKRMSIKDALPELPSVFIRNLRFSRTPKLLKKPAQSELPERKAIKLQLHSMVPESRI